MSVPLEPMSLHRGVAIGGSVPLRWFPGLHSVPLEIRSPTKAAVVGFLDLLRHGHTLLSELSEGAFEVMDSVIHLRRGMADHRIDEGSSRRDGGIIAQSVCLSKACEPGNGVFVRCRERATSMIYRVFKKLKEIMDDILHFELFSFHVIV